ncbi:MAG: hypothetical protein ACRETN_14675 [Nevskiales bacterium]
MTDSFRSQAEINQTEWNNPDNLSGRFGFYFSKRDSRLWVPKHPPWFGWTINLGHPYGGAVLIGALLLPLLVVLGLLALNPGAFCTVSRS